MDLGAQALSKRKDPALGNPVAEEPDALRTPGRKRRRGKAMVTGQSEERFFVDQWRCNDHSERKMRRLRPAMLVSDDTLVEEKNSALGAR
jgi:hypothetical protein